MRPPQIEKGHPLAGAPFHKIHFCIGVRRNDLQEAEVRIVCSKALRLEADLDIPHPDTKDTGANLQVGHCGQQRCGNFDRQEKQFWIRG